MNGKTFLFHKVLEENGRFMQKIRGFLQMMVVHNPRRFSAGEKMRKSRFSAEMRGLADDDFPHRHCRKSNSHHNKSLLLCADVADQVLDDSTLMWICFHRLLYLFEGIDNGCVVAVAELLADLLHGDLGDLSYYINYKSWSSNPAMPSVSMPASSARFLN